MHFNPTNSIYTFNHDNGQILISTNNSKSKQILYSNLSSSTTSIFVTVSREIFVPTLIKEKKENQHKAHKTRWTKEIKWHKSLITSLTLRLFYRFFIEYQPIRFRFHSLSHWSSNKSNRYLSLMVIPVCLTLNVDMYKWILKADGASLWCDILSFSCATIYKVRVSSCMNTIWKHEVAK